MWALHGGDPLQFLKLKGTKRLIALAILQEAQKQELDRRFKTIEAIGHAVGNALAGAL